jgi:hypothetical protein
MPWKKVALAVREGGRTVGGWCYTKNYKVKELVTSRVPSNAGPFYLKTNYVR